jgi:hypothetical protein
MSMMQCDTADVTVSEYRRDYAIDQLEFVHIENRRNTRVVNIGDTFLSIALSVSLILL